MDALTQWTSQQVNINYDAQKSAQLKARLGNLGFSNAQAENATAAVKTSGAFDAMDKKPSSFGAFVHCVKEMLAAKSTTTASAAFTGDAEALTQS